MLRFAALLLLVSLYAPFAGAQVPQAGHVVVVLEENHSYDSVVGNGAMPYVNSLASQYGLATNYYGNTHPSIGNYFMITTGQIITNDDGFGGVVDVDNVVRQLLAAGKSWKAYIESLPSVGYTGDDVYPYIKHHNPFAYLADVVNSNNQRQNIVPFSQFRNDLNNGALPNYSFVVPNTLNNAHDGSLATADAWLQQNIAPLLNDAQFQRDGILIIAFDESDQSDGANGGGRIAVVVASPAFSRRGFISGAFYQHQNLLRTTLAALGSGSFPGAAANAAVMADFFGVQANTAPPTSGGGGGSGCGAATIGVTVCSPAAGSTVGSPVTISAAAAGSSPIVAMAVYVDDQLVYEGGGAAVNTSLPMADGSRFVVVLAWDSSGRVYKATLTITVGSVSGGVGGPATLTSGCASQSTGVTLCSPANGSTVGSLLNVNATAAAPAGIVAMHVYVDDQLTYQTSGASVNTSLALGGGGHFIVVLAWDNLGNVYKSSATINANGSAPASSGGCAAASVGVTVCTPGNGSTVDSPVAISATARAGVAIDGMAVYVDDQLAYQGGGGAVNTSLSMASGSRFVVVQAWDVNGQVYKAALTINVR